MAEQMSTKPALLTPENGAKLPAGAEVILSWEAIEEATEYQVQVSTTPDFHTPSPEELIEPGEDMELHETVLDMIVKGATALDVSGALPSGGVSYYWRVRARLKDGNWTEWSDTWQFFLEEETVSEELPDEKESFGPAAALVETATEEAKAELTGHYEAVEEVEPEGLPAGEILGMMIAIFVALIVLVVALYQLVRLQELSTYMALTEEVSYPIREKREMEGRQKLTQYGVVDPERGIYRIPIDRAMELMVNEAWESQQ